MPLELGLRKRIDTNVDPLATLHVGELGLLEVGGHPDVHGDDRKHDLPRDYIIADLGGPLGHAPCDRGLDLGVGELKRRVLDLGLGLIDRRLGRFELRPGHRELCLGRRHGVLAGIDLRRARSGCGVGVIDRLAGDGIRRQRGIARLILPCLNVVRFGRTKIGRRLVDIRRLQLELRLDLFALRHRRRELSPGLGKPVLVVERVDLDQHLSRGDLLVVANRNHHHRTGHLRADLRDVSIDEGVVARDVMEAGLPSVVAL